MRKKNILEKFNKLQESYSPVNAALYNEFIKSLSVKEILENSEFVFIEPIFGAKTFLNILKENIDTLSFNIVEKNLSLLENFIYNAENGNYSDKEHLSELKECYNILKEKVDSYTSKDVVRKDLTKLYESFGVDIEKVSLENIAQMVPDVVTIYDEEEGGEECFLSYEDFSSEDIEKIEKELEYLFSVTFVDTIFDDSEEIDIPLLDSLIQIAYLYDKVQESKLVDVARKSALKAEKVAVKTVHGIRKVMGNTGRVGVVVKRIPKHFENLVNSTIGRLIKMDREERRKRIIEGGYRLKIFKLIRNIVITGAFYLINPALAALTIIGSIFIDKRIDDKVRSQVLEELNTELRIVKEKIKDADSKNDNKAKYQLMRLEDKLESEIHRITTRSDKVIIKKDGVRI